MQKRRISLFATLILQVLLIVITFQRFFFDPSNQMLTNIYDGFKNYLTFHAYIQQENFSLNYQQMNYPYGDFITYTDNTPLLAIIVKIFSKISPSILVHDIFLFNMVCLFSILISTYLLFRIFTFLRVPIALTIFFSILLPWISPQLERLNNGHFNLSFSWIILTGIWLLIRFYYSKIQNFSLYKTCIGLIILIILSSYIHLYHTSILLIMMGGFGAFWWFTQVVQLRSKVLYHESTTLLIVLVIGFIIALTSLSLFDTKIDMRQSFAEGYDYIDWKLRWESLISSLYDFPIRYLMNWDIPHVGYESYLFLGSTCIIGGVIIFFSFNKWLKIFEQAHTPFLILLLACAFMALSIAFGEKVFIGDTVWTNRLNPFYFLHKITDRVEQFRCLSRFGWIFFWVANILVIYCLGLLWSSHKIYKFIILILISIASIESYYFMERQFDKKDINVLQHDELNEIRIELMNKIDTREYQAILPVPYFHVGCENYDYTIDPNEDFFIYISQLSIATKLPNMGSKMSRTPVIEAQSLMSIFLPEIGQLHHLKRHLNKKSVLVVYDKSFYKNIADQKLSERTIPKHVILKGEEFIRDLELVHSSGKYEYYKWNP